MSWPENGLMAVIMTYTWEWAHDWYGDQLVMPGHLSGFIRTRTTFLLWSSRRWGHCQVKGKEPSPIFFILFVESLMNILFFKLSLLRTLSHNRAKKQNSNEQLCKNLRLKSLNYPWGSVSRRTGGTRGSEYTSSSSSPSLSQRTLGQPSFLRCLI